VGQNRQYSCFYLPVKHFSEIQKLMKFQLWACGEARLFLAVQPDNWNRFESVQKIGGARDFEGHRAGHMGYWENRVPPGQQCYVHYAIGRDEVITEAFEQLKGAQGWVLKGVYHAEPQSSAYPASFPVSPAPYHWSPDETLAFTEDSVFWFNFFPAQPALFEKTFAIWVLFQMYAHRERGECNQLCAWKGKERLEVRGVDPFVQVN
jgi:hypothetical protein